MMHTFTAGIPHLPQIHVSVVDENLWKEFSPNTEMILTRKGRSLFPKLEFKVNGLNPADYYAMQIRMERVDNIKYKFDGGEWHEANKGEPIGCDKPVRHSDGPRLGKEWMESSIGFHRLKITNNQAENRPSHIILHSMHKYRPVLTVINLGPSPDFFAHQMQFGATNEQEFRFDFTTFIAVTAYQNQEVTRLKVKHNKYARGFRSEGSAPNRKRSASPEGVDQPAAKISPTVAPYGDAFPGYYEQFYTPYPQFYPPYPYYPQYFEGFGMGITNPCSTNTSPSSSYNSP